MPNASPLPSMRQETTLLEAKFDPKLKTYWMLTTQVILLISIIGVPLMPLWLLFGWNVHSKQYERLSASLTDRSLNIQKGWLFRLEKNVPLEKIQDLTMREGPLLRWLGLALLHVETAGQNVAGGGSAHLVGVVDAPKFRDAVLTQRERVSEGTDSRTPAHVAATAASTAGASELGEIRDSLQRIEALLERGLAQR